MLNCRPILQLPHAPPIFRSNHNLISILKRAKATKSDKKGESSNVISSAIKKARANKSASSVDDKVLNKFPKECRCVVRVNSKFSHRLYLMNEKTAVKIARHLTQSIDQSKTFVEANPGLGLLTNLLVESGMRDLRLLEKQETFLEHLQETYARVHPDRVKLIHTDLITLPLKANVLAGADSKQKILSQLPSADWKNDTNFRLFIATGSTYFLKQLIRSIVFQYGIMALGRCELYMVMPSMLYMTLASSNTSMNSHYQHLSLLFQIFFEYQLLDKFPRADFLPNIMNSNHGVTEYGKRLKGIQFAKVDRESMYFVKIVPRRDLYERLPSNQIQELLHFTRWIFNKRQARIIPLLEKILPGCGNRLIRNYETKESVRPQRVYEVDLCETPPTTNPSMTLSDHDYGNLNAFTCSGDLQPSEVLTLFSEFRTLPAFSTCSFLQSLQRYLLNKGADSYPISEREKRRVMRQLAIKMQ